MKTICLYFQVHQPWRLKTYRFFNIGNDHNYLDDLLNRSIMQKVANDCYLPMNSLLLSLINASNGAFKCSFSITGIAIEQFKAYAPEVLESFKALAATGCVEFLAETYSHSLSALKSDDEFKGEVERHADMIKSEFGVTPTAFRNTELIYNDSIGEMVAEMGYKTMLAEGARHVMGWKSSNYVYANALNQKLRLLMRNFKFADDIAFRFSNEGWDQYPLTADKYVGWLCDSAEAEGDVINLFMDYETFGEHQKASTGIFDFMKALPSQILAAGLEFATVSEAAAKYQPASVLYCPHTMSWADEERDVTAWLGNDLQNEAFAKIYALREKVLELGNSDFDYVWRFMQTSDHFYYMATKWLSDGDVHSYFNPYDSAYEAFINYMNVLSDFEIEIDKALEIKRSNIAEAVVVESAPVKKTATRKPAVKKAAAAPKAKATTTKKTATKAPAKRATKKAE
ncbi:MAG: glycoside hydrolase family 57 protein [Rikenellaceae bacterium]